MTLDERLGAAYVMRWQNEPQAAIDAVMAGASQSEMLARIELLTDSICARCVISKTYRDILRAAIV